MADVIERSIATGDIVGLIVARRRCRHQADMPGNDGHGRKKRGRLEIGHILRPALERAKIAMSDSGGIGQKYQVEPAGFSQPGQVQIVLDVAACVDLGIGVQP